MLRIALFAALFALTACEVPAPAPEAARRIAPRVALPLPPMKAFGAPRVTPPRGSNAEIARDFLELSFQMESGRPLPVLSRFEGPVTLRLAGPVPQSAQADTGRLIARLRAEADIDIRQVASTAPASITIEFLPRARMQALVPQAACFVVPREGSWDDYRRNRRGPSLDWTALQTRTHATIFVPSDTAPQEIRDCLHEEVAQALGPLNDLYRLPDSVFNDDNFHTVLTGFDMMILRAYYSGDLRSGMDQATVAARLPAILSRINPRGGSGGMMAPDPTPRAFVVAMETALGPRTTDARRRSSARQAVALAERAGWRDPRAGFAWFALGRLSLSMDPDAALGAFLTSRGFYRSTPGMEVQAAHVDMQLAAFALSTGQAGDAIELARRAIPAISASENAALLATLMMIQAEALDLQGRASEARALRLDAMGWARYGFGSEASVRRRLSEIAALSPLSGYPSQ